MNEDVQRVRRWIGISTLLAVLGIGISATGSESWGSWITIAGLAGALFALHRLGRTGPDMGPKAPSA